MLKAIKRLPIGDAITITKLAPVIASILGVYFLAEPWYLSEMLAAAVSTAGIGLVSHPTCLIQGDCASASGVVFALLCALSSAGAFVTIRLLGTVAFVPWYVIAFTQSLGVLLFSLPFALTMETIDWSGMSAAMAVTVLVAGTMGTSGQFAMTFGMQQEKSALASAMRSSDILFGYVLQSVYTSSSPDAQSTAGAGLVVLGMLALVLRKQCLYVSEPSAEDGVRDSAEYALVVQDDPYKNEDDPAESV